MLKSLNKLSKPMQYAVIGSLIIIAYLAFTAAFPGDPPATGKKTVAKKTTKKAADIYLDEDYKAKFEPVNVALKNSFKPLIAKSGPATANTTPIALNVVPTAFTGGEANWTYTGTVTIDGRRQALLENKTSGDSVFLLNGDRWKGISVSNIADDSVTMASPSGQTVTLHLLTDENTIGAPTAAAGFAPVTVNPRQLRGNIGFQNVEIRPEARTDNEAADNGDQNAN